MFSEKCKEFPVKQLQKREKTDNIWSVLIYRKETKKVEEVKEPREVKRPVNVVGHKNPDTDSICSAIAYSYLKNIDDPEKEYVPRRAGEINEETRFVLDYFDLPVPKYLANIGPRVKDMEIRRVNGIRPNLSIKRVWNLMKLDALYTIPITTEDNRLEGLISINDIAQSFMENYSDDTLSLAKTQYTNILDTLEGEMIVGNPEDYFDRGKVVIAAANPDVMEDYIGEGDMVILGNRYESQLCAIEMNAGCIVVCLGSKVSQTIRRMAEAKNCRIIVTNHDTFAVARLINQSIPVGFFMKKENLLTFKLKDYTEEIKETMASKRYRDFPINDSKGYYVGMISRRNLLGVRKRSVILVDHNEVEQAVDNIHEADILEIIDHHRIGTLETMAPVYFRNQPVGCTATIVYQIFQEKQIEIPKQIAGILCSAILSDTLMFRSPTCTIVDRIVAEQLAKIAGIEVESFATEMFKAGSNLMNKTPEEIFNQDFKCFEAEQINFGVGQINSMNRDEVPQIREKLLPFMEQYRELTKLNMVFFMVTNILEESSEILICGKDANKLIEDAFHVAVEDTHAELPGIVSRKKQLIPALISTIGQNSGKN